MKEGNWNSSAMCFPKLNGLFQSLKCMVLGKPSGTSLQDTGGRQIPAEHPAPYSRPFPADSALPLSAFISQDPPVQVSVLRLTSPCPSTQSSPSFGTLICTSDLSFCP